MTSNSLNGLYPQARKYQFELKNQLNYLESDGRGGTYDMQKSARENLSSLEQLIEQLASLTYLEPVDKRDFWIKKIQQLQEDKNYIKKSLENYLFRQNKNIIEAQERESLLSRRSGITSNSSNLYAAKENESLQRSTVIINDLSNISKAVLNNLGDQRNRLKSAHRKVLDIATRLGLSNSLLRIIERRETVDGFIVYGGMFIVLVFFYICYAYLK